MAIFTCSPAIGQSLDLLGDSESKGGQLRGAWRRNTETGSLRRQLLVPRNPRLEPAGRSRVGYLDRTKRESRDPRGPHEIPEPASV